MSLQVDEEIEVPFLFGVNAFEKAFQFPPFWLEYNKKDVFYVKQWEYSLDEKYPHIVYHEHCKACDAEQLEPSSMEDAGSDKMEEELVKGRSSRVSWEKIDVSFHHCKQRFAAHSVIQVTLSLSPVQWDMLMHMCACKLTHSLTAHECLRALTKTLDKCMLLFEITMYENFPAVV
ncbi:hypothetical protein WN944_024598 [Citrus x changshan-huyou]|uniref:Uncharacterized protein n=1 Tax=Citrus x changshan-huyou TaxID=2935761 RepID=A0AAP0QBF0_9ROSI